jgi:hypothetical protein
MDCSVCDILLGNLLSFVPKNVLHTTTGCQFLLVEQYSYLFYALAQPACIPRSCVLYENYFTNLLSTVVRRFMRVLNCSACLDKIVSKIVKVPSSILISVCY